MPKYHMHCLKALICLSVFFLRPNLSQAVEATRPGAFKDKILQMKALFLARDRASSLAIFQSIELKNLSRQSEKTELIDLGRQISSQFYTEKGQRAYEEALVNLELNPKLSIIKMTETEEQERGNILIDELKFTAYLKLKDYQEAQKIWDKLEKWILIYPKFFELGHLLAWFNNDTQLAESLLKKKNLAELKSYHPIVKVNQAWLKNGRGERAKALLTLEELNSGASEHLPSLYFAWKWGQEDDRDVLDLALRWTKKCQDLSSRVANKRIPMFQLCMYAPEVEKYISHRKDENYEQGQTN